MTTLTARELNRATLDRQLLLRRRDMPAQQAVRHLAGLQAQAPHAPYVGLWCRLSGFTPETLSTLITERTVVRAPIFRGTVHAVGAEDFLAFRPLFDGLMAGVLRTNFAKRLAGADMREIARRGSDLLAGRGPLTRTQLGQALAASWPDADPSALAYVVTYLLPVVQVPPRGIWGKSAQATWASADSWLPGVPAPVRKAAELLLRYLAAFGPATVADAQVWSGLTRLREVTEQLDLRTWRGPDGAELLDLPDLPMSELAVSELALPDEDVPAPPRFLPEFDNLLLSHADRSRVNPEGRPPPLWPGNGATRGTLLVDGLWEALWEITKPAALTVSPFRPLTAAEKSAIEAEGVRLLEFTSPGASPAIRFA
ncbi:MAG: winged helix DNA-binding domain-containing protein [Trebonia sp.]